MADTSLFSMENLISSFRSLCVAGMTALLCGVVGRRTASVQRGRPFGSEAWQVVTAEKLGLEWHVSAPRKTKQRHSS